MMAVGERVKAMEREERVDKDKDLIGKDYYNYMVLMGKSPA